MTVDPKCTCDPPRQPGLPWYAHQPGCPLRRGLLPDTRPGHTAASTHVGFVAGCPDCERGRV